MLLHPILTFPLFNTLFINLHCFVACVTLFRSDSVCASSFFIFPAAAFCRCSALSCSKLAIRSKWHFNSSWKNAAFSAMILLCSRCICWSNCTLSELISLTINSSICIIANNPSIFPTQDGYMSRHRFLMP